MGGDPKATALFDWVLDLNSRYHRLFVENFYAWDRVVLVYDSTQSP